MVLQNRQKVVLQRNHLWCYGDAVTNLPLGEQVEKVGAGARPRRADLVGNYVALKPLDAAKDAPELFAASHGDPETEALWTYMGSGPFGSQEEMTRFLEVRETSDDPLFFTVYDLALGQCVGVTSFMNIVPEMRRLELGNIWYSPRAQRTRVNTETIYLMLRQTFNDLGYRRVEWKCDALNARSRAAALRLGFSFEGILRQHMVVKGRNRDTAYFSMLDKEWPQKRAHMEAWLYGNEKVSLREMNMA